MYRSDAFRSLKRNACCSMFEQRERIRVSEAVINPPSFSPSLDGPAAMEDRQVLRCVLLHCPYFFG